jgi:hypothetical protein
VMISTTRKKQLNERTRKGNRIFNVRRNRRRQRRKKKRLPSRLTSSGWLKTNCPRIWKKRFLKRSQKSRSLTPSLKESSHVSIWSLISWK